MSDPFLQTEVRLGDYRAPTPTTRLVRAESPFGGPVWVITDPELAETLLTDRRISKDPAYAPPHWPAGALGVQPPSSVQPSLTTMDGEAHLRLRRAHAPLFTARRLRAHLPRITEIARTELADAGHDLVESFAMRYPLAVVCDVLGVPDRYLDEVRAACLAMLGDDQQAAQAGVTDLVGLVGHALDVPGSLATELRARLGDEATDAETAYHLFGLVFAGQVTTASALTFLVAHYLAGDQAGRDDDEFVRQILHRYPPAEFSLWSFSADEIAVDDEVIAPRTPVLMHIEATNAAGGDFTFGVGAHFCIGAQLAQLELVTLLRVLREDFPHARLTVPIDELRVRCAGIYGRDLTALPVSLGAA